jgi:hypothetical protein
VFRFRDLLIVHEMGHVFDNILGFEPRKSITSSLLTGRGVDVNNGFYGTKVVGWQWRLSGSNGPEEIFADMFVGWVYNRWETEKRFDILTPLGQARSDFMNENMAIWDPFWSPDGKHLSFYISKPLDARDTSAHGPYLADSKCPEDASECKITPASLGVEDISISKWTPDNMLAVAQENRITLYDPVTRKKVRSIVADGLIHSFIWSPDNQWIAYKTADQISNLIYILPTSGGQPSLVSENGDDVMFWLQIK